MILDSFRLEKKVALVTGGNRGLGQGMAVALAQAGADVAVTSRSGDAAATLASIDKYGHKGAAFAADFTDPQIAQDLVTQVVSEFGRIDILVNNAGTIRRSPALELGLNDWRHIIDVNLTAVWVMSQSVGRQMVERGNGGSIINVASLLSFQGGVTVPAYTASKHAIAGLTKALANEWAPLGINVNALAPGYMVTDNTEALRSDSTRYRQIRERIPAGRWGEPTDIAGAVVFLASDASRYVHGQVLAVDGGWLAR
ncbi:MAG: 2-dehydro-3-deoxy-D-gluconate 5-dehydrogenase KduD [Acidimicrobiia bacterium]|nr:MAG: 2-dehydro-3-deoxy-D-gluconate 5-dehydrogenase KduD [Acidimicrobiia bacterium]